MLSGRLYTGWDDGKLYSRPFDATNLGAPTPLELYGLPASAFPVALKMQ